MEVISLLLHLKLKLYQVRGIFQGDLWLQNREVGLYQVVHLCRGYVKLLVVMLEPVVS